MDSNLIIVRHDGRIITGLFEENRLAEVIVEKCDDRKLLGNIYLGKVKNIVENIGAAFVEIADKQMCYLSMNDVRNPVFTREGHKGVLKPGDELLVQVSRDSAQYKAPLATVDFNLTGRYMVLVHGKPLLGISQKIKDENERNRLKQVMKDYGSQDYGFIVRTNAEHVETQVLREEAERLTGKYLEIVTNGIHRSCFSTLYTTPAEYLETIRDVYTEDIACIKTDDEEIYNEIRAYMEMYQPDDLKKLSLYKDETTSLYRLYGFETKLERALEERVWLDSGAFMVICHTEACNVIDINTGKAISGKTRQEDTFLKINLEAAVEVARQIRLRNLSGIIIVDFIDMQSDEHKNMLLKKLSQEFSHDRIPTKVIDITKLGLVEITRKKTRKPLHEQI